MRYLIRLNDLIKGIEVSYSGGFAIVDIALWLLFLKAVLEVLLK